jgi:hypothetical protein
MNAPIAPQARWHVNRNPDHTTRHPEPTGGWHHTWKIERFTEEQKLQGTAIHEAAHTVLYCAAGAPITSVLVRTMSESDGSVLANGQTTHGPYRIDLSDLLTALAAGERAEDRWLREVGLWTPERAWAIERHAREDRRAAARTITSTGREMTVGTSSHWSDLASIHQRADEAIDKRWSSITALATALLRYRHLDAQQIQDITGIPNPALRTRKD